LEYRGLIHFVTQYIHAKMASRKIETYQIEPRTNVLFMFQLDNRFKIVKKLY